MKKNYTFLFLLLALALGVRAQNAHYSYGVNTYNGMVSATSAVTVICSGGKAFLAQTDDQTNSIYLTEINPSTMQPIGYDKTFLSSSSRNNIRLRGGFESLDGKIILYGYCYDNLWYNYGYIAEIVLGSSPSLQPYELSVGTEITKGCSGYDVNGFVTNMFVFKEGRVFTLDPLATISYNPPYPPTVMYYYYGLEYSGQWGYFSDVIWSSDNNCFVASGCQLNTIDETMNSFIDCFTYNSNANYPNRYNELTKYSINHNDDCIWTESRSFISEIDADNLVLYQNLRDDSYEVIWLTMVHNYMSTPTFPESTLFYAPLRKLFSYGMVYDRYNYRLNLLGQFYFCQNPTTIIAQADPLDLSYLNIGQISSTASNTNCFTNDIPLQLIYGNEIVPNNIVYNPHHPCSTVVSTCIAKTMFGTTPLLMETYDITVTACDYTLDVLDNPCSPSVGQTLTIPVMNNYDYLNPVFSISHTTYSYIECKDVIVCTKDTNNTDVGNTKNKKNQEAVVIMSTNSEHFICYGFEGVIHYQVFDPTGKLVNTGETLNGESNSLVSKAAGLYIIRCTDADGRLVTQKVFINR